MKIILHTGEVFHATHATIHGYVIVFEVEPNGFTRTIHITHIREMYDAQTYDNLLSNSGN